MLSSWGWEWVFAMLITADLLSAVVCLQVTLSSESRLSSGPGARKSFSSPLTALKLRVAPLRLRFMSLPRLASFAMLTLSALVAIFMLFVGVYAFRGSSRLYAMGSKGPLWTSNGAHSSYYLYSATGTRAFSSPARNSAVDRH